MSDTEFTAGPLSVKGPSPGIESYDDGGDYAIVDGDGRVIGEAFHHVGPAGDTRPAKANAELWAKAPDLRALVEELLDPDPCYYDHNDYCQAHGYHRPEPDGLCGHGGHLERHRQHRRGWRPAAYLWLAAEWRAIGDAERSYRCPAHLYRARNAHRADLYPVGHRRAGHAL